MKEAGYVYILTNPSFKEDWVKIGKSSRPVDVRSKELDNTAVPLPFEIYATLKTSKYEEVEKLIHKTIDRLTAELGFPREKAIMLEHMILAHHYEPEFGSPKKPLFPEAEVLHYLDILDARMFDLQAALDATEPGEFSDRVWTLDNRRLYKPQTSDKDGK